MQPLPASREGSPPLPSFTAAENDHEEQATEEQSWYLLQLWNKYPFTLQDLSIHFSVPCYILHSSLTSKLLYSTKFLAYSLKFSLYKFDLPDFRTSHNFLPWNVIITNVFHDLLYSSIICKENHYPTWNVRVLYYQFYKIKDRITVEVLCSEMNVALSAEKSVESYSSQYL